MHQTIFPSGNRSPNQVMGRTSCTAPNSWFATSCTLAPKKSQMADTAPNSWFAASCVFAQSRIAKARTLLSPVVSGIQGAFLAWASRYSPQFMVRCFSAKHVHSCHQWFLGYKVHFWLGHHSDARCSAIVRARLLSPVVLGIKGVLTNACSPCSKVERAKKRANGCVFISGWGSAGSATYPREAKTELPMIGLAPSITVLTSRRPPNCRAC